jgi:hypothetical protein
LRLPRAEFVKWFQETNSEHLISGKEVKMKKRIFLLTSIAILIFHISQNALARSDALSSTSDLLNTIEQSYGWKVDGNYTSEQLNTILKAGGWIENYVMRLTGGNGQDWIKKNLPDTTFHINGKLINSAYQIKIRGFVFPYNGVYLPDKFTAFVVVHELGHVLDNNLGGDKPAVWFGGGAADQMLKDLGGHPEQVPFPHCLDRSDYISKYAGPESWPDYMNGGRNPADDFADTFLVAVVGSDLPVPNVLTLTPHRLAWMDTFVISLQ